MNKLSNTSKLIVLAVAVVVAVILIVVYGGGPAEVGAPTDSNASTSAVDSQPGKDGSSGSAAGTGTNDSKTGGTSSGGTSSNSSAITLITPVPGVTWKIGTANIVSWAKEGNISGQIELLDAVNKNLVGVILTETGVHQTSYSWNTRDINLSRTNPAKTTVKPGEYIIRISFDGNNLAPIVSQPITIAQ